MKLHLSQAPALAAGALAGSLVCALGGLQQTPQSLRNACLDPAHQEVLRHMSLELVDDGTGTLRKTILFSKVNVQVVNGLGATNGYPANPSSTDPAETATNGLGNLILGYGELTSSISGLEHTGSHNLVLGTYNAHTSFGSIVGGRSNFALAPHASVITGLGNRAFEEFSSILGGWSNETYGFATTVSGGRRNFAYGDGSSVSGGRHNSASGDYSSVSGGGGFDHDDGNFAIGDYASVSGGSVGRAIGNASSVAGGIANQATGGHAAVLGGWANDASGGSAAILGGYVNEASGLHACAVGGDHNLASGTSAVVCGGRSNEASGYYGTTVVVGGDGNMASGHHAVVCGGSGNEAEGTASTVGGGQTRGVTGDHDWAAGSLWEDH